MPLIDGKIKDMNIKVFIAIFVFVFILFLFYLITLFRTSGSHPSPQPSNVPIPIYSPSATSTPAVSTSPSTKPSPSADTGYTTTGFNQNYQRTVNATLSPADQNAYNRIVAAATGSDSVITSTNTFQLEYVNPPGEFLIEMLSNSAEQGREDAVTWLKAQGLSADGVCKVKMVIYLSPQVKDYYQQHNLQFNPVPDGC